MDNCVIQNVARFRESNPFVLHSWASSENHWHSTQSAAAWRNDATWKLQQEETSVTLYLNNTNYKENINDMKCQTKYCNVNNK